MTLWERHRALAQVLETDMPDEPTARAVAMELRAIADRGEADEARLEAWLK